jgi:hypothetical protein
MSSWRWLTPWIIIKITMSLSEFFYDSETHVQDRAPFPQAL